MVNKLARVPAAWAGAALALAAIAVPATAHHSFAMFDQQKIMTLKGTVTEFQWTNPHAFIEMDVPGAKGTVHWSIELNSPNNLKRQGWHRDSLHRGDQVTLRMNPLRDGKHGGLFLDVRLANGKTLDSGLPKNGTPVNVPQV
ncbi:MAG: hypothetical protein J0I69_02350 [Altererythrobacter sp.]|nr:hypothetical protein [Altererythrobacter sp.]